MPGRLAGSGVGTDGVTYCNCEINQWPKSSWHFRVRLYFRIKNLILLLCRSMRRLMNVIYVMGRLLKAFRHVNLATNLTAPSIPGKFALCFFRAIRFSAFYLLNISAKIARVTHLLVEPPFAYPWPQICSRCSVLTSAGTTSPPGPISPSSGLTG